LNKKRILFLTGTRADFGKLKSLIKITRSSKLFDVHIFATGMHMHHQYGYTVLEIEKSGFDNVYKFINYTSESTMDLTLAKTIDGLSAYVKEERPDLLVVHGDRVEALAGAITGALNNILVAHVEGGEVSGTIDELIRHAVSKMSHIHFVSNALARKRLLQMGEMDSSIYEIGSPDVDVMFSASLPSFEEVSHYYDIPFSNYGIAMFHPVTTEEALMENAAKDFTKALLDSGHNYVVIYPNNDLGSHHILKAYESLNGHKNFRVFPSLRFEYFLRLLKSSQFIIGNSSAGIREAPYYGIPSINIGSRQQNRALNQEIVNVSYEYNEILAVLKSNNIDRKYAPVNLFGAGRSDELFLKSLSEERFWNTNNQKVFKDLS
jgi:UDP-N-acetylglucosamine 2-epimerase (hydrolysing)